MLAISITSCMTKEEKRYYNIELKHKEKMLDIEYKREVMQLKTSLEVELLMRWCDSIQLNESK